MDHDLYELIEPAISRFPESIALVTPDGQSVSFSKLAATVDAFTAAATARGLKRGDRVNLEVENYSVQLCLTLALSRLGVVTVMGGSTDAVLATGLPLDVAITLDPRKDAEPRNLIFDQSWFTPPEHAPDCPGFDRPGDMALIVGSSGTTGQRKFMPMSVAQFAAHLGVYNAAYGGGAETRLITVGALTQWGFLLIMRTLMHGGTMVPPADSPRSTLERIIAYGVEELCSVPNVLMDLVQSQRNDPLELQSLKKILTGGGSISLQAMGEVQAHLGARLRSAYGATEVGYIASAWLDELEGRPEGAVGFIRSGAEVEVVGETGTVLPHGGVGEIRIRTTPDVQIDTYLAKGPEAEDTWHDGWFYPGDTGSLAEDGMLVVSGRTKDVINIGGNKLAPASVEATACRIVGVRQAGVVGLRNSAGFEDVCVVTVCDASVPLAALQATLSELLGSNTPLRVKIVEALPLNAGGKLDREQLRQWFAEG
jgi:acyl-coenzyme A synthetase/AMP-(fatty) acid ligase